MLLGGAVVGFDATRGRLARRIVGLAALVGAGSVVPLAMASRRPPIPPEAPPLDGAGPAPTFSVVVAARDEATVLPRLVRDIAGQDYCAEDGSPLFELVVVDDRSGDGTADAVVRTAKETGLAGRVRVIRRDGDDLPDGKGAALTAAQPDACRGDVVVVLDADARVKPAFLSHLARYVEAGADAITARRRILAAGDGWLAGAQADEQTLDGEIQRGRWSLGGCSEFRGNGIVIRRDLLRSVGGWRAEALTEDLDLSSRVAAGRGIRVAWAIDAEVWEEPVLTVRGLVRQRERWAEGALRRMFEYLPRVIRSHALGRYARLDALVYGAQLATPPMLLGAVAGGVVRRRPGPAIALLGTYFGVGAALGWDSLRWESDDQGRPLGPGARLWRAVRVALFSGLWLVTVPSALLRIALRRGAVPYVKMDHSGAGSKTWLP